MGQRTNPIIFRSTLAEKWKNKLIEKKTPEFAFYTFKVLEIKQFIYKFFQNKNLYLHRCKIHYSNNYTLHIYLAYCNLNEIPFLFKNKTNVYSKLSFNYSMYKNNDLPLNVFKELFYALKIFTNIVTPIELTLCNLNKGIKKTLNPKTFKNLKKNLIQLRSYEEQKFYKQSLKILLLAFINNHSADFAATLIANQLSKIKRHNFFMKFLKKIIFLLKKDFLKIEGFKVKLSGRLNGRPRAKHKTLLIGKNIPNMTINAKIDYSEKTAYTANGTLGVKVWIYYKNVK